MKLLFLIAALAALSAVVLFPTISGGGQGRKKSRQLMQKEQEWIDAVRRGDTGALAGALADDFIATVQTDTMDKTQFIAALKNLNAVHKSIVIGDSKVRIYGDAAVSTGRAGTPTHAGGRAVSEPGRATQSATVDLNEAARREAASPPRSGELRVVPAPLPPPGDRPVPSGGDVPLPAHQYLYTAVYIRRQGRWQAVTLHLTRPSQ